MGLTEGHGREGDECGVWMTRGGIAVAASTHVLWCELCRLPLAALLL